MPVRNGERFLAAAIQSILQQSFDDFELIVIDDGSTDATLSIVASFLDPRLSVLSRKSAAGNIASALNAGIEAARAPLIARMDADDVANRDRLGVQVRVLDEDPTLGVVGSFVQLIDERGMPVFLSQPVVHPAEVDFVLHFRNPFHHPAVMLRRARLEQAGGYIEAAVPAEDYDLFARMSRLTRLCNIPDVLLQQRLHAESVSAASGTAQRVAAQGVSASLLEPLGLEVPDLGTLAVLLDGSRHDPDAQDEAARFLRRLYTRVRRDATRSDRSILRAIAAREIAALARRSSGLRRARWATPLAAVTDPRAAFRQKVPRVARRVANRRP